MRKLLLSVIAIVFCISAFAQQTQVIPLSVEQNKLELKGVTPESFTAKVQMKELKLENKSDVNGEFSVLNVDGFVRPSNVGQANLPVISKLIEVPYGAEIQVVINGYTEEVINLSDYGISRIEPTQPSYHKSVPIEEQYFVIDQDYYNSDQFEVSDLISTEIHGEMRGVRIGRVEIRPYHYNPIENTLIVYNNLDFEVTFVNADLVLTQEMKNKYYTPEFEGSYASLLNYQEPAAKDGFSNYAAPIKYVIVANTAFQATLQPFVQWKTKQGYNVIEYYVASGTTNTSIKTYLQGLYTAGTPTNPAPLYVMIIGDHSGTYSIPGFTSTVSGNSHVTDLYFATYGGASDYLPDLFYGRISAESTTELSNALNKILPYEQYTLPDFSYLNNCLLVAGTDASWAHKAGDATLLYGVNNYFNVAHGFSNIYAYYYNYASGPYFVMSSNSSAADADVNTKIASGVGFGNYTAHCDHDGWSDPAVRRSNIANWNNVNEYPFLIGNCCLSFEYNQSDAFGEMLLYAQNEGAVGYIGTTNFSYWYEDVYWGIGLTTTATIDAANITVYNYSNTGLGVYDGIFHENGEAYSNWYYTARQIVHKGNMAVDGSTSTLKKYYWEIYHCVGDPSLMPYMTEPNALSLSFPNPMQGATSITVTTEPYTYVAISKNNVLLDAEWTGSGTSVSLTVPAFTGNSYCIVGTKQDRSPYINESVIPTSPNPPVAAFSGTPTTILEGQSVTFTDASQYPASWAWNFGDTETSTVQNPVHVYSTAGTYTVSLTVTNGMGNDAEVKTNYITVNPNINPPTANFIADVTTVTMGGTVNFTDLSINNPASWSWSFVGGTPATSTNQNPSVVYSVAGTYQVVLTATNSFGSDVETKLAYITVNTPDYCTAASNSSAYEYISKFVCNTISKTSTASVYSDFTATSTNLTIGSAYTATITVTGGFATDQGLIWVDWNRDGDFIDAGESVLTSANGVGPYTGNITVPGTCTAGNVRVRVRLHDTNTSYTPNATPCGNSGYGEVEDYTFVLVSAAVAPVANFSADNTSGCGTLAVQFTDLSTGTPTSWAWNFGDSQTSTLQNPSHTYASAGTYTVVLTATNTAGNDGETKTGYIVVGAVPTAVTVTGGGTQCGGSMTLAATGGTGGTIYWQNTTSNGTSTASASASQSVSASGTYYFRSQSSAGCWGTQGSATVTINPIPTAVTVTGGGTQCGGSMTLAATGGTGGTIYWENTTSNGTSTATASASQSVSTSGTYYFRAKSTAGCWGNQGSATVTIYPSFTASAVSSVETSAGANDGSVTVSMIGGTSPFSGAWTPSGSTNTVGTSMTLSGLTGGYYNVTVTDNNGCTANAGATVNTSGVAPIADFEADVTNGCDNLVVTFTDLSNNTPVSWEWNFGDGSSTSSDTDPVHTYATPGSYTVSLTVTNAFGNDTETMTDYITVGVTPLISMSMTEESVSGNDGTATVNVTGGQEPITYIWSVPGGTATISGLNAGEYCVTVIEANGCQALDCITVTQVSVLNPPVAGFEADVTTGCGTLIVQFTDLSTNSPSSWAWDFGDASAINNENNPVHVYNAPGTYTVTLTVENADGTDSETIVDLIFVGVSPEISVDVVQASGELVADGTATVVIVGGTAPFDITWSTSTSGNVITDLLPGNYSVMVVDASGCIVTEPFIVSWTNGISENVYSFSIFPNPAKELVTVSLEGLVADNIEVTNALGQSIISITPESNVTTIDLRNFEIGVYFIKVYVDGKEFVNKLVIN